MTVFIDANVFVSARGAGANAEACDQLLDAVVSGQIRARTSVGVVEELWHLELARPELNLAGTVDRILGFMGDLLPIDEATVRAALDLPAKRIGAYDRIHVATCLLTGIDTIITADKAFDELDRPRRLDPVDAVAELLA